MIPTRLFFLPFITGLIFFLPTSARAQRNLPEFPHPQLLTISPCGGRAGTTVNVTLAGIDLEDAERLLCSHPGIHARPIPSPPPKKQPPPPAVARFRVTIDADTPVGIHDLRLVNKWGVSNPRAFVVGDLPEMSEKEPNNDVALAQRVSVNSTITGVIGTPTDVDYFVFSGSPGQRVIISCLASSIDSRLRPQLDLYDADGKLLDSNYHYRDTDALLDFTPPRDGNYTLRLSEYTYTKGNAEHFYRLTLSTAPWIDAVFPPMVQPGRPALVTVLGRNLPGGAADAGAVIDGHVMDRVMLKLDPPHERAAGEHLKFTGLMSPRGSAQDGFELRLHNGTGASNPYLITYALAPVVLHNGVNDKASSAQAVVLPCEIAGRVEKRYDRDWYSFTAKKGAVYSLELFAERLGSPEDMYFELRDARTKKLISEGDDTAETLHPQQFFTRTLDPRRYRLAVKADTAYLLRVASRDEESEGSPRRFYRLRITPEQPDFRLVVMPAAINAPDAAVLHRGECQALTVFTWRLDGWNGEITLTAAGLPHGISCPPQVIGPGLKQGTLVVTAAADAPLWTGIIHVKGTATIRGRTVIREARPASITWPVSRVNVPAISRLDRDLVLAVRDQVGFTLDPTVSTISAVSGSKISIPVSLRRRWPELKAPCQITAQGLPANIVLNGRNQTLVLPAGKDQAIVTFDIKNGMTPGHYNLVLRGAITVPFSKDATAKRKTNVVLVRPSTPILLTVLPKPTIKAAAPANKGMEKKVTK